MNMKKSELRQMVREMLYEELAKPTMLTEAASAMSPAIERALAALSRQFPGYDFTATYKGDPTKIEPKKIMQDLLAKLRADFPDYAFALARTPSYPNSVATIKVKAKPGAPSLWYYGGDDVGYLSFDEMDDITSAVEDCDAIIDAGWTVDVRSAGAPRGGEIDIC